MAVNKGYEMNKKEAETKLDELIDIQAEKFCPLIKQNCVMNCVCLVSRISRKEVTDKTIYKPFVFCDNGMFYND